MTVAIPQQERLFDSLPGRLANGVFTVQGPRGHRTVKIRTVLEGNLKGKRIIAVMTGPDNIFSYTGVGFVKDDDSIQVWMKQRGGELEKIVSAFRQIYLGTDPEKWKAYRIEEARHCLNCNRLLTSPTSIAAGIGPVCDGRE
jgi:Family of unknown function (DUF6011)